jgi:hypothetical protein
VGKKIQLDGAVLPELRGACENCWSVFGRPPIVAERQEAVVSRFRRFDGRHDSSTVNKTVSCLHQGTHLVIAALSWAEAVIGPEPYPAADTNRRSLGETWRLVMAYSGVERIVKALLLITKVEATSLAALVGKLSLPDYRQPISPPTRERGTRLSQAGGYRSHLRSFLQGQTITNWGGALCLAQSLRHVTAHGALSPTKVKQHQLRWPIVQLTADLGRVTTAIASRLSSDE